MLNDKEQKVVDLLAEAWDAFCDLPKEHSMDQMEFCSGVHVLQDKVLARPARRAMNGKAKS